MGGHHSQTELNQAEEGRVRQNDHKIRGMSRLMYAKADHEREKAAKGWDKHDENMKNTQLLKGLFKTLDPTMMKAADDVKGEVQVSFKYDFKRSLLLVKIIKCRDLRCRDLRSKMPDPYVRLLLIPDNDGIGEKKTHVVKQSNDPHFDEIFALPLDELALMDLKLVVDVLDDDILGKDESLGQVVIEINTFKFKENPVHTAWYMLTNETDFGISGDLDVTLAYQIPHSLFVTVHRASALPPREDGKPANPFCKLHVPGTKTYFQTQVVGQTLDPEWEETFEFEVAKEELQNRSVIFHVVDEDKSLDNESLGQVVVDLKDFDIDRGLYGSYKLADLRNTRKVRSRWSQMTTMTEFRQSLQAHALSKQPGFLFSPHSGHKVINVSCRKAGAFGKIRMVEGIPIK